MEPNRLFPQPGEGDVPAAAPGPALVVCPLLLSGPALLLWQQMQQLHLYQAAYKQMRVAEPPRHEQLLMPSWN